MVGVTSAKSCARSNPGVGAVRFSELRQSGAVALARSGTRTIAYVADEDSKLIHTIDVDKKEQIARTSVKGEPSQVLVLADGRVAVTLKDTNAVEVLEPNADPSQSLASICTQDVPAEPVALAETNDDKTLLVTSAWGAAMTALDAETLTPQYAVDLPRDPRAIVVDDSGDRAFVSHGIGAKLSVVDLTSSKHDVRAVDMGVVSASQVANKATDRKRSAAQGYALAKSETITLPGGSTMTEQGPITGDKPKPPIDPNPAKKPPPSAPKIDASPAAVQPHGRIFVPMVTVDPGDPNVRSQAYYGESRNGLPKEAPMVGVIDVGAERSMTRAAMSLGTPMTQECLLPRAAASRASNGTLFVTCLGVDALLELDTRGADPIRLERRRWSMPSGPTGLAWMTRAGARSSGRSSRASSPSSTSTPTRSIS